MIIKNIMIIILSLFITTVINAQNESESLNQSSPELTYEEAVKLLTAHEDEFTAKGEVVAFPTLGKQIANARKKYEVSVSTLAFIAGLDEETITKIENDKITPTRDIISKIERFLGEEIVLWEN